VNPIPEPTIEWEERVRWHTYGPQPLGHDRNGELEELAEHSGMAAMSQEGVAKMNTGRGAQNATTPKDTLESLLREIVTDTFDGVCPYCGCVFNGDHCTICPFGKARKLLAAKQ
jgi:hypothetical protein